MYPNGGLEDGLNAAAERAASRPGLALDVRETGEIGLEHALEQLLDPQEG